MPPYIKLLNVGLIEPPLFKMIRNKYATKQLDIIPKVFLGIQKIENRKKYITIFSLTCNWNLKVYKIEL